MDRIQQFVFEHRRTLAAVFTGLAVLTALTALRQTAEGAPVLVARHDLRSGHVITPDDVRTASVPLATVPGHTLDRSEAIGSRLAGPMREGEAITDYRVLRSDSLSGYDADAVLTTIRVGPADGASGIRVGDRVDVIAVDPDGESRAEIVARDVEIVTMPTPEDARDPSLGILTSEKNALALTTAGLSSRFSVIRSPR